MLEYIGIGTPRTELPQYKNEQFNTLEEYNKLAKIMIINEVGQYSGGLAQKISNSDDCIANISNVLMMADWKWNGQGSKYGYRKQCVQWAIRGIVNKYKKNRHIITKTLNTDIEDIHYTNFISNQQNKELVDQIINSTLLTKKQKQYIQLKYIEGYTLQEIGNKYSVSRQNIQQTIKEGIKKLQNEYSNRSSNYPN